MLRLRIDWRNWKIGRIIEKYWLDIPKHFDNIKLDEHIVMPNHIHGIIIINSVGACHGDFVGTRHVLSLQADRKYQFLPTIIGTFKSAVTRQSRKNVGLYVIWQRSYYDHIIRTESSLNKIRQYIKINPQKWEHDRNNPANLWI